MPRSRTSSTGLDKPIEYVRRILEKLERCRRAHGDAQVRIALKSRAECPNYLIEYASTNPKTQQAHDPCRRRL